MTTPGEPLEASSLSDDVADDGVFEVVRDAYEAVYDSLPDSPTFTHIWRTNAYRGEFPEAFAHIGFLTLNEAGRLLDLLAVPADGLIVDAACGTGGPGLWVAQQTGASLVGIDPTSSAVDGARQRAEVVGLGDRSRFQRGTFEQTGLADDIATTVMSIEAFQYAPDKLAALTELHRVLGPGGRLALICFEVDPAKADGLPILGVDPVADYRPLLEASGYAVETYEETPGWEERVYGVFGALVEAGEKLTTEMGEAAAAGVLAEAMVTVSVKPYPRRILLCASCTGRG